MAFTSVKDQTLANIVWSDVAEYRLSEFVDQFTLPQAVKVLEGYHGTHEDSCISIDQVLMLHSVKTTEKALVRDGQNTELCIPLNCSQKLELCPDAATTTPLSKFKFARVTQEYIRRYAGEKVPVCRGDKLEVVHVKRDAEGKEDCIVFQNLDRKESFILPLSATTGFQPLVDGREYYLKEVSVMRLPVFFQFIDPDKPVDHRQRDENVFNSSLGVLKLEQVYHDSSVICTTTDGGTRTVVTCPITLPILVAVAQGALVGDKDYVRLCNVFHAGISLNRVENMESENIYASPDSIREYQYIDVADKPPVHPRTKSTREAEQTSSSQKVAKPGSLDSAAKELLQDERQRSVENIYEDPEALMGHGKVSLSPLTSPASRTDPNVSDVAPDSNVPGQTSQMSVTEVSNFLKSWSLGDFVEAFSKNDVDGEILVSMNAQDMNDLGMNSFQSKKLLMLISGWRPKTESS